MGGRKLWAHKQEEAQATKRDTNAFIAFRENAHRLARLDPDRKRFDDRSCIFVIEHMVDGKTATAGKAGAAQHQAITNAPGNLQPRWPALVALLAVGVLRLALPNPLSEGPNWLLIAVVLVLAIPTVWTRKRGLHRLNEIFGYILLSVVTADMIWSLGLLVSTLPAHQITPLDLLRASAALWISNIIVFASWYWHLDAGGPHARDLRRVHAEGAFLFPQMTMRSNADRNWSPGFVDYLFLAFNTSTAFSPTDCPVLTRWAKVLMMLQSLISLATIVLLAARAVNIL